MKKREQEQIKIAKILFDLGLDISVIEVMTSLSQKELKKLNQ